MRILVTGGAGFIGANFILYMLNTYSDIHIVNLDKLTYAGNLENLRAVEKDSRYTFLRGDICDGERVSRILADYQINIVVNFAAESHVDRSIKNADMFVRTNVQGTITLLEATRQCWQNADGSYLFGVRFLQVSTDEVYGSLGPSGYFTEDTPLNPHSPYSASKASADLLVRAYWDTHRLPVNITRCSNNYGPYQFPEKLIPLMIYNATLRNPLPVYGDGQNIRDWLHVKDHCRAIDMVLRKGRLGEVYNIGGENEQTNIDIVRRIINYLHKNMDSNINESLICYVPDRQGHDRRYGVDADKIHRELGWSPQMDFEQELLHTIDWYIKNGEWLRNISDGKYAQYYNIVYGDEQ